MRERAEKRKKVRRREINRSGLPRHMYNVSTLFLHCLFETL